MTDEVQELPVELTSFVAEAVERGAVWALQNEEGYAWCESEEEDGANALIFWSSPEAAIAVQQSEFTEYAPEELPLSQFLFGWLPGMNDDEVLVGVNWTPQLEGLEVEPDFLQELLLEALPEETLARYQSELEEAEE
jgi:hypothetical protein